MRKWLARFVLNNINSLSDEIAGLLDGIVEGSSTAIVVAASDTPEPIKEGADYVCDGTADEVEIQTAIDEAQSQGANGTPPPVFLGPGTFHLSNTVWVGYDFSSSNSGDPYNRGDPDSPASKVTAPSILGCGRNTWLQCHSEELSDKYLLVYTSYHGAGGSIQGLMFHGDSTSRGLLVMHCTYGSRFTDLRAYETAGVGLDFVDCWGAVGSNLAANYSKGYGIRITGWNGGSLSDLRIGSCDGYDASHYPASDYVKNYAGNPAYPADSQCGIYIGGGGGTVLDIQVEGCDYRTYPAIYLRCSKKTIINFRFEGGHDPYVYKQSDYGIKMVGTINTTIEGGQIIARHCYDENVPVDQYEMYDSIYLEDCKGCAVRNIEGTARNAIVHVGPGCEDITVEGCYDRNWDVGPPYSERWPSPIEVVMVDSGASRVVVDGEKLGWCEFDDGDATPSLRPRNPGKSRLFWNRWRFAVQTNDLTVTQFDDAPEGFEFYICRSETGASVTLQHDPTKIRLAGGADYTLEVGEVLKFVVYNGVCVQV